MREKILIVGDSHGDHQDYPAIDAVLRFKKKFKPNHLVHLGDNWDFACLRKGASIEERALSTADDFEQGCEFVKSYFSGKAKSKIFMMGNHDHRIIEAMESTNAMTADHAATLYKYMRRLFKGLGVTVHEWDSAVCGEIHPIRFIHGMTSALNAPHTNAQAYAGKCSTVVAGHNHYYGYFREASYDRKEGYSCPCLCDLKPDYARRNIRKLRMSRGWLYGWIEGDWCQLYCAEERDGKFVTAANIEEF